MIERPFYLRIIIIILLLRPLSLINQVLQTNQVDSVSSLSTSIFLSSRQIQSCQPLDKFTVYRRFRRRRRPFRNKLLVFGWGLPCRYSIPTSVLWSSWNLAGLFGDTSQSFPSWGLGDNYGVDFGQIFPARTHFLTINWVHSLDDQVWRRCTQVVEWTKFDCGLWRKFDVSKSGRKSAENLAQSVQQVFYNGGVNLWESWWEENLWPPRGQENREREARIFLSFIPVQSGW